MNKFLKNLIKSPLNALFLIGVVFCLLVSYQYRNRSYNFYPPVGDTFDELAYGWLGLSLLQNGVPTSWSFIPDYAKNTPIGTLNSIEGAGITIERIAPNLDNIKSFPKPIKVSHEFKTEEYNSHFDIVFPYLEQPPLGGLIIAAPLRLNGTNALDQVKVSDLRKPFIFYGVLSTALVILLSFLWFGKWVGVLSGFINATVPTIVIGSHLALPENLLTPLLLLQLILLTLHERTKNKILIPLALLLTFIAPLIKLFGLSLGVIAFSYFVINKKYKTAILFMVSSLLAVITYIAYGLFYDKNTFLAVASYQSARYFSGPLIFLQRLLVPRITKIFLDGWIIFGWLSVLFLSLKNDKKNFLLILGFFSYLLLVLFFGGEDFGWYRFPLYPLLSIASGVVIIEIIKAASVFPSTIFLLSAVASSFAWGSGIEDWSRNLTQFRFGFLIVLLVLASEFLFKQTAWKRTRQALLLLLLVFSLYLNTRTINNMSKIWPALGDKTSVTTNRQ